MQPPFLGTKIIDDISLADIEPLIEREALFASRWQFRQGADADKWDAMKRGRAIPLLERLLAQCRANSIIEPKIIYGYFKCRKQGNGFIVTSGARSFGFDFPRERKSPNRCLADFFPGGFVAIELATVGPRVVEAGAAFFSRHEYSDAFFLRGLAAEAAEATAAFGHGHIRRELGADSDQGERFSPGYPSFPDIFDQRKIAALLDAERIGVALTETCQLVPEYSTSSIISIDPKAMHFRP